MTILQISKICKIGKEKKEIAEYIRDQCKKDSMMDQIAMKEYKNPFTNIKKAGIKTGRFSSRL